MNKQLVFLSTMALLCFGSPPAKAAPDCNATATATSFSFANGVFKPQFNVKVLAGCGIDPSSTGKVSYGIRVEDKSGHADNLKNLEARWFDRRGASFTFSPSNPENFSSVRAVTEIVDVEVQQCGCTN